MAGVEGFEPSADGFGVRCQLPTGVLSRPPASKLSQAIASKNTPANHGSVSAYVGECRRKWPSNGRQTANPDVVGGVG